MKKLTKQLIIQLVFSQYSYGRPPIDERIERVFDITQGDRVNIDLAERVGVSHLAVSYPQGINCTLMKTVIEEPFRLCRNLSIPTCKTVQKVRMTNVTEDCSQQAEYCQYNFRTQEVTQQTIICQKPSEMVCDDSCSEDCQLSCERNPIVVCNTVPQTVAITEKKQRCGLKKSLQTTKICFTYPDASWVCKEPRETLDCDEEGVRLVAHEVAMPRIECQEKEMEPLCIPENCQLKNSNTDCLTTDIPTEVKLEDQVCEICQEGRTKLRPVVIQEEECDSSTTQEFCSEGIEDSSKWTKTCSVPRSLRDEVLKQVLENTRDEFNEIPDVKNSEQNDKIQESKIIRMKLPLQVHRQGTDSSSTIEGADIFFAKQFFQNDLVRKGKDDNEVVVHTNQNKNDNDKAEIDGDVAFEVSKVTETPKLDMKVNFNFDVPSSTMRPTGVPYVYSDITTRPFTRRPPQSHQEIFNTRFGSRPTPQPSRAGDNGRAGSTDKNVNENTDNNDIDSIIDLISDTDFNLALPLPSNVRPFKTNIILNQRGEDFHNEKGITKESSNDKNVQFPFLAWQDKDIRNLKIRERLSTLRPSHSDQIIPSNEFHDQRPYSRQPVQNDAGPLSNPDGPSSNTIGITEHPDSHPKELQGPVNRLTMIANKDVKGKPGELTKDFKSLGNTHSSFFAISNSQRDDELVDHRQNLKESNTNAQTLASKENSLKTFSDTNQDRSNSDELLSWQGDIDGGTKIHQSLSSSSFDTLTNKEKNPNTDEYWSKSDSTEPTEDNFTKLPKDGTGPALAKDGKINNFNTPSDKILDRAKSGQKGIDGGNKSNVFSSAKPFDMITEKEEDLPLSGQRVQQDTSKSIKSEDAIGPGIVEQGRDVQTTQTRHESEEDKVNQPNKTNLGKTSSGVLVSEDILLDGETKSDQSNIDVIDVTDVTHQKNQFGVVGEVKPSVSNTIINERNVLGNTRDHSFNTEEGSGNLEYAYENTKNPLRDISPRKLEVVGSDDEQEPIFQGRIHEESTETPNVEVTVVKTGKGMCDQMEEGREKVRCKVIACFRDNQYCF